MINFQMVFPKNSRSLFGLEIIYKRELGYQKLDFKHENTLGALRVYTSILPKMSTLALAPEIAYVGFLTIRNSITSEKIHKD